MYLTFYNIKPLGVLAQFHKTNNEQSHSLKIKTDRLTEKHQRD